MNLSRRFKNQIKVYLIRSFIPLQLYPLVLYLDFDFSYENT
jgi:hypothetical protein